MSDQEDKLVDGELVDNFEPELPGAPPVIVEAPPTFGKQMAQLVGIPALIVIGCIGLAVMFTMLAGGGDSVDTHLRRLRNPGGLYHDRARAAAHLGQIIVEIEDEGQKKVIAEAVSEILANSVNADEKELIASLVVAQGRLGQPGGLEAIIGQADSEHEIVRHAVGWAVASWPDVDQARVAIPTLVLMLDDVDVRPAIEAARVLGILARVDDVEVIESIRGAMEQMGIARREVHWNAAVALARLGDEQGSRFVADVLLDREVLAKMVVEGEGGALSEQTQVQVMLATLATADGMESEIVWERIAEIAVSDSDIGLRNAAKQLMASRGNK